MSFSEYVVFGLGEGEYGIDISFTQEIIRIPQTVKMPNVPSYIEGMISLRDRVIPVINLAKRFGLPEEDRGADGRVVVLNLERMLLGIIVDDVKEVLQIDDLSIENIYREIPGVSKNSIKGIGKTNGRLIVLLDVLSLKEDILKYDNEEELYS